MKNKIYWSCLVLMLLVQQYGLGQTPFNVQGNGIFRSTSGTNVDILSEDDNTNSLMRFGDNGTSKVSIGYNGNNDYFVISTAATLGAQDLTLDLTGHIGVNTAPGSHRMLIQGNSTSGIAGSAHLTLQENNTGDYTRMRFSNLGDEAYWEIRTAGVSGLYQMDMYYTDGLNEATFLSIDGDEEFVGVHKTSPEGYLHLKQQFAGVDALAIENDNATGGDKWSMRIGDEDILIYFNNDIRGGFDVSTGNYNNFPPSPALANPSKLKGRVLDDIMKLQAVTVSAEKSAQAITGLNPYAVEKVNADWVVRREGQSELGIDYLEFSVLVIKAIQEQEEVIARQGRRIEELKARKVERSERLAHLEQLAGR